MRVRARPRPILSTTWNRLALFLSLSASRGAFSWRYLKLSRGSAHPEAGVRNTNKYASRPAVCALATCSRARVRMQRQAHNIMHRRYCAAARALVTVTSSGTTFLTLARVPAALGARQHAALLWRSPLRYPFPLPIFTPVLPPFFLLISLSLSFSFYFFIPTLRSRVGYEQCSGPCKKCITRG